MIFSVGATGGGGDVTVVVVVLVVVGACLPLLPHPVAIAPTARTAAAPMKKRLGPLVIIVVVLSVVVLSDKRLRLIRAVLMTPTMGTAASW